MSFQIAALAGATALSAYGTLAGGYAQARGLRQQAGQYASAQQDSKVQTLQEEVARRRRLIDMTGANTLDAAGRDISLDSGSFGAIMGENARLGDIDISSARYMGDARTRQLGLAAHLANSAASSAIRNAWIGAGVTVLSGAYKAFGGMGGDPPSSGFGGTEAGRQQYGSPGYGGSERYGGPR